MTTHHFPTLCVLLLLLLSFHTLTSSATTAPEEEEEEEEESSCEDFIRTINRKSHNYLMRKKEKLSHFKFYWHDIMSGQTPTVVTVVPPVPKNSSTFFGMINIYDDPLTVGPDLSSKLVGRSQGLYAFSSLSEMSLLMAMTFTFTEGKYNGSSITILGRNAFYNKVREMPVVGGSGRFRFARGYAEARTRSFDMKTNYVLIKYDVYVYHH